jgi:hypothetical protein
LGDFLEGLLETAVGEMSVAKAYGNVKLELLVILASRLFAKQVCDLAQAGCSGEPSQLITRSLFVTLAICADQWGKVAGKSCHVLAVMNGR